MPTILHCADVHLDSPLRGLPTAGDAPVDELRGATRLALANLVDLAVFERVDAVVIAGDLYDGERDDFNTAIYLQQQYRRLVDEGIAVIVVHGNHDAASEITRRLRPPEGVHVLSHGEPETVVLADRGLAFHGQSYATRAVVDDLAAAYPAPVPGLANIGVLHTALDGRAGHDPYAPCTAAALAARGYGYWALGHVHQREELEVDDIPIVFPGNLQGRHARETGPKGATLVTFDGDRVARVAARELDVVRWVQLDVDVSAAATVDEVCSRMVAAVSAAATADEKLHAVRVTAVGATPIADRLVADRLRWEAQVRADLADGSGRLWLEKLELRTTPSSRPASGSGEAIAAVRSALEALRDDAEGRADLARLLDPLRTKLGVDATALEDVGATPLTVAGVGAMLDDVESLLLAELGEA